MIWNSRHDLGLGGGVAPYARQAADVMALQASMQRRTRQMWDARLQGIETVIDRQQRVAPKRDRSKHPRTQPSTFSDRRTAIRSAVSAQAYWPASETEPAKPNELGSFRLLHSLGPRYDSSIQPRHGGDDLRSARLHGIGT